MNRRIVTAAMALSLSVLASQAFAQTGAQTGAQTFASPATGPNATNPTTVSTTPVSTVKTKHISFHLRNDSGAAVTIQAGDQQMTVAPGKSISLKLAEGTKVTTTTGTSHVAAGGILATVDSNLSGNTLVIS